MTLYFNNSMSFYLQHTLKSTHINLDTSGKLANLRRDLRHIKTLCSALSALKTFMEFTRFYSCMKKILVLYKGSDKV